MKEQLTLQELSAYLPYKVMCLNQHLPDVEFVEEELIGISNHITWSGVFNARHGSNHVPVSAIRPVLYPLSHLTKEIEHKGEKFVPSIEYGYLRFEEISTFKGGSNVLNFIQLREYKILLKLHFDVFGLIDRGLAISK